MFASTRFQPVIKAIAAGFMALLIPASYAYDITPTQPLNSTAYTDSINDTDLTMDASDDTVIAAWMDHGTANGLILLSRSTDGGITWSPVVTLAGGFNRLEIIYVGNDNWTIFDYANSQVIRSADDGLTWSGPIGITSTYSFGFSNPPRPASNNAGLLLTLYTGTDYPEAIILKSLDGGATWVSAGTIPQQYLSEIIHSGGSNWVAFYRDTGDLFISGDNGATWVSAGTSLSFTEQSNGPYIETDHAGKLVASATETSVTETAVIYKSFVSVSSDHGMTWSPVQLVHENSFAKSNTTVSPSPSSWPIIRHIAGDHWKLLTFDLVYYFIYYGDSELSLASSYDGGLTWTASEEIVPDVGNWVGNYSLGAGFLTNVFSVSQGNLIAAWELANLAGDDVDIACRVISDPDAPPPPSAEPAPNLTGLWAPAEAKCKTSKKGITKCNLKATFLLCNTGTEKPTQKSNVRFYLSIDDQLDPTDVEIKSKKVKKLKAGKQNTTKVKLKKLPSPVTGQYVIAVLDADQNVQELDEADNIIVSDPLP